MRFCEHCHTKPVFGTDKLTRIGYCKSHQYLRTDISKETILQKAIKKQRQNVASKTATKLRTIANTEEGVKAPKDYAALDVWFKERRKEMVGVCSECGKQSFKHSDKQYKWSICHITPKSLVPSVATNKFNFIELCWLHHQEFDNTFDKAANMSCFEEVKQKFKLFKNLIPAEELRKVNPHLLKD